MKRILHGYYVRLIDVADVCKYYTYFINEIISVIVILRWCIMKETALYTPLNGLNFNKYFPTLKWSI